MKRIILLLFLLAPFAGYGEEDPEESEIRKEITFHDDQRSQSGPSFSAELLSNGSIKVLSSKITTFTVKICNASTGAILYQGSTVEGVLHITTHFLQAGRYVLQIETADASYSGEFDS